MRRASLPLAAIRVRVVLLGILTVWRTDGAEARRLSARVQAAARRVPPLLRCAVRAACARATGADLDAETRAFIRSAGLAHPDASLAATSPVADLESLLEIAHKAPDDRQALTLICEALGAASAPARWSSRHLPAAGVCERRPWPGEPESRGAPLPAPIARRVLGPSHQPPSPFAMEIAAVACRWIAGSAVDVPRALSILHIGALALAPHVRACLDREPQPPPGGGLDLLGDSGPARALRDTIARAARAPFPVLIEGESGSGKELVARGIHRLGPRRERRFCALNCAALSDDLVEAELFGHMRGAFTGAVSDRPGLFEEADGGTLFLDEIGELSLRAQAKLLRVLQDGECGGSAR